MKIDYNTLIPAIYTECKKNIDSSELSESSVHKIATVIFDTELKSAFDDTILDFGGHNESMFAGYTLAKLAAKTNRGAVDLFNDIKQNVMRSLEIMIGDIHASINSNTSYEDIEAKILKAPVYFYLFPVIDRNDPSGYCFVCGRRTTYYMKDGSISAGCHINQSSPYWDNIEPIYKHFIDRDQNDKVCDYPDGIQQYEQYMTIKSNYLVVNNYFRNLVDVKPMEPSEHISKVCGYQNDINSELGVMINQEYFLSKGLLQVQVGNTSPNILLNPDTGVILAVDPNAWRAKKKYTFPVDITGFKPECKITTDVWTVQAVDSYVFEEYAKEHSLHFDDVFAKFGGFLIPVTPGRYKITNYNAHHYSDRPVFFSMEKVD